MSCVVDLMRSADYDVCCRSRTGGTQHEDVGRYGLHAVLGVRGSSTGINGVSDP